MDTAAAPAPSRAGRNLPVAIGVGLGLGGALLLALFVRKEAFVVLAAAAVAMGIWELAAALATRRRHVPVVPLLVGTVGTLVATYVGGAQALLVSVALSALAVLAWRLLEVPDLVPGGEEHREPLLGAGASALRRWGRPRGRGHGPHTSSSSLSLCLSRSSTWAT